MLNIALYLTFSYFEFWVTMRERFSKVKLAERERQKKVEKFSNNYYYLTKMTPGDFKKICAQKKIKHTRPYHGVDGIYFSPQDSIGKFTKEEIERFPKYLRRGGGEYEHDERGFSNYLRRR